MSSEDLHLSDLLEPLPIPDHAPDFWQRLEAELEAEASPGHRSNRNVGHPMFSSRRLLLAAAAVVVLAGIIAAYSLTSGDEGDGGTVVTDSPPAPGSDEEAQTEPRPIVGSDGLVGPGSWSVLGTFPDHDAAGELPDLEAELRSWPGVIDVATARDKEAWRTLTGLEDCPPNAGTGLCTPGVVALVVNTQMAQAAQRLESEFGLSAMTVDQDLRGFVRGYLNAALDAASPAPLRFDTGPLGSEVRLSGPMVDENGDRCYPSCGPPSEYEDDGFFDAGSLGVQLDVDGTVSAHAVVNFGSGGFLGRGIGLVTSAFTEHVSHHEIVTEDLVPDRYGRDGLITILREVILYSDGEARRMYVIGGLPLEAAVVAFELADGTSVWQRPIAGLALVVDNVGSVPGTDSGAQRQPDPDDLVANMPPAAPISIFNSDGTQIMQIVDTENGDPAIIDLRIEHKPIEESVPDATEPDNGSGPEVTDTIIIGEGMAGTYWTDAVVETSDGVWLATGSPDADGVVVRFDRGSREATDRIALDGYILHLVASPGAVWVLVADVAEGGGVNRTSTSVARIDTASRQVTETFQISADWATVSSGGIWLTGVGGFTRIDLDTFEIENHILLPGLEPDDEARWLGAGGDALWSVSGSGITRLDPATREQVTHEEGVEAAYLANYEVPFTTWGFAHEGNAKLWVFSDEDEPPNIAGLLLGRETIEALNPLYTWGGVLVDGGVWAADTRRPTLARFDPTTGEVTDVIEVGGQLGEQPVVLEHDDALWTIGTDGIVSRVDPTSRRLTRVTETQISGAAQLVLIGDEIWALTPGSAQQDTAIVVIADR